ncbi:MAG: DUF885 family protein, partial [Anaerolineae bacterium]|nr:DUF885 family protein [Anaerolineae bacterium]
MSHRYTVIATILIILILVSACATPTPPATSELPTAAAAVASAMPTGQPSAPATQPAAPAPQPDVPAIAADLQSLDIDTFFEASYKKLLLRDPEMITQIGLNEAWGVPNDGLTDISDEHVRETQQLEAAILTLLRSYDRAALTPEQQVTYDVYQWHLEDRAASYPFMYHDYPASFLITTGINEQLLQFFTDIHPVTDKQDAEDYVTRLSQVDTKLEQLIAGLKLREQAGVVMPRFLVPWVLYGVGNIARSDAQATPFYTAFKAKVEALPGLSADEKEALLQAAEGEIDDSVLPGFQALAAELERQQRIAADDAGVWKLPDGENYYAYALRHHTTTDLTAAKIHQLGLDELERIHAEMRARFDELGYPQGAGLPALIGRVVQDSGTLSGSAVADAYEALIAEAWENLGAAFDLRPTANVVVQAGPAGDYYNPPAVDGSRPGVFYARVTGSTEKFAMPTLAYHEAVPGHHFQIAIAQQLPLPLLRKDLSFMAYTEGWALYAEQLAYELGFYEDDPYGDIGRLQAEAFRAARLVVDTGLHDQKWSYDQAVEFMIENTGLPRDMVETEVARYIVWPGQATAYKIGMIQILELRQRAMDALGDRFDLKAFHNVVLGNGAMPLEVLERVVDDWIAAEQGQAVGGAASLPAAATQAPASTPTPAADVPEPVQADEPDTSSEQWLKTYGGTSNTVVGDLLPAGDGGFFVVGTTNLQFEPEEAGDVYLLRTDAAGEIVWEKTYGGEGYDGGQSIAEAGDGKLLITGVTSSFDTEGIDAYLLKVDREGNEMWARTYGGPLDEMTGAVATVDGGYLLGGNIVDPNDVIADPGAAGYGGFAGRSNLYLLKVDGEGNELWSRAYDSEENVLAAGAVQTADGGVVVLATITDFPEPDDDILLIRLDADGDEVWSRTWEEGVLTAHALAEATGGGYLIAGSTATPDATADAKEDFLFIQADADGHEMWRSTLGEPDVIDYGVALSRTADGGYIVVGERTADRITWESDITLVKIDARGRPLWRQVRPATHT